MYCNSYTELQSSETFNNITTMSHIFVPQIPRKLRIIYDFIRAPYIKYKQEQILGIL